MGVTRIFPRASSKENNERLATEYNLASIVNRLVDRKNFVISVDDSTALLNLDGYYIEYKKEEKWPVYIKLKLADNAPWSCLESTENENDLIETSDKPTDPSKWLHLSDDGVTIRNDAYVRIDSSTHSTVIIDDGDLDN